MKRLLKLLIFYAVFALPFFFINEAGANNLYRLDVRVYPEQRTISGTGNITFINNTRESLDNIYFLLGLNNSYDTRMKITEVSSSDKILPGSFYKYDYLGKITEDRSVYRVSLPSALAPGQSILLQLKFEVSNLSKINDILFLDDNIYDLSRTSWYPRLIRYKNGQWEKMDFITNNYEVSVTLPNEETLAASALESSTEKLNGGQKKVSYKINSARGFSLATSPRLVPETLNTPSGVTVSSYYQSNKVAKWNKTILDASSDIISFYNQKFGFYPYKLLSIVPGNTYNRGGYSNNNLVVLHDSLDSYKTPQETENNLKWHLAHNIAQQYFGYYVSESGEYPKWVISGASLYMAYSYAREKSLDYVLFNNLTDQYLSASRAGFNTMIRQPVMFLNQFDFDWENIIEKGKSAQVFKMLETMLGRKTVQDSLKEVLTSYKNSFVDTGGLQAALELNSNKKLDWFFNQWIKEDKNIDYALTGLKQTKTPAGKYQVKINVKKIGDAEMPVSIAVSLKNGSKVFQVWEGNKSAAELTFEYSSPAVGAQLDPAGALPDTDTKNNSITVTSIP